MDISEFKIKKNKQRPDFCYAYEKYNMDKTEKYSIFTMDGGNNFLVSITNTNGLGKLVDTVFSATCNSVKEGLFILNNHLGAEK